MKEDNISNRVKHIVAKYLGIEEETATMTVIDTIHNAGKKVMVSQFETKNSDYYKRNFSWGRRILQ